MPPLSIATPVYNAATFLSATIESVLAQTFSDFEYLILDDGSSDASADIAEVYARADTRIRVIRQTNQGIARTRNRVFHEARAPFVAFLDHDDIALPRRMELQLKLLERHPSVVGVGCYMQYMRPSGDLLHILHPPHRPEDLGPYALSGECPIATTALMVRKDAALATGGLNPAFEPADDYEFLLRLLKQGDLALVPEVLQLYTYSPGNTSHRRAVAMLRCAKIAAALARKDEFFIPDDNDTPGSIATEEMLMSAAQGDEAAFWSDYLLSATTHNTASQDARKAEAMLAIRELLHHGCTQRRRCASRILRELSNLGLRKRLMLALRIVFG